MLLPTMPAPITTTRADPGSDRFGFARATALIYQVWAVRSPDRAFVTAVSMNVCLWAAAREARMAAAQGP